MAHTISDTEYIALVKKTEHLQAENESLKALLQEYMDIVLLKQKELQQQEAAGMEIKVNFENQYAELQSKKNSISELLQKTDYVVQRKDELEKQVTGTVTAEHLLDGAKMQHDHLQAQLNEVSDRLLQLNQQHILQQQYAGRIAELESLLANAEDEIEGLKNNVEADESS